MIITNLKMIINLKFYYYESEKKQSIIRVFQKN